MADRLVRTFFPILMLAAALSAPVAAQDVGPDSLLVLGRRQLGNVELDSALTLYQRVLAARPRSARAAVGVGWISALRNNLDDANAWFARAEEWEPGKGHRQFGEGLIALAGDDTDRAKSRFQTACRKDRSNADPLVELGRVQALGAVERFAAKRTFRMAIVADPMHPTAYLEQGLLFEAKGSIDDAIDSYEDQLRVNPESGPTLKHLGFALLDRGRSWHARQRLFQALQFSSGDEQELTLALAASYMYDRQFERAHDSYVQAFQLMDTTGRAMYDDIALIGSPREIAYADRVSGEQRLIFLQKFWLRRDPTPVTAVNERMLEHFRRVWYSGRTYSRGHEPWDDRGEVYIRYGEPEHISTSRQPNFAIDSDVDGVRDRYLHAIYGSTVPDVLQRGSMPSYPLVDPDDYRNNADDSHFLDDLFDWQAVAESGTGEDEETAVVSEAPRFGIETGSASLIRWEEWTYTTVGNGLQVTFVDRIGSGDFQFATPPPTNNLQTASVLRQYAPEEQVSLAARLTPERYFYDITQDPLNFYYYTAQFRTPNNSTELDVYYGLPMDELSFQRNESGYTAIVESGVAVYDTLWNVKGRVEDRTRLVSATRPSQDRGAIHVDRRSIVMRGGGRILLSVQAEDAGSGRLQAYQENVTIARFDSTRLSMSDVVVAGAIVPVDSASSARFARNGLSIVPMASRSFRRGDPVYVYFEIYNLTRGPDYGETEYEVEHAIRSGGREGGSLLGGVGRILGGSSRSVGVGRIIAGIRDAEFQNFRLDTSTMTPGDYTLIVTVRDLKSDERVTKQRKFHVGE